MKGFMKRVKIPLDDLLVVLEAMKESDGTKDIIFMEYNSMPAICDAEDPDNIISFSAIDEEGNVDESEIIH